MMASIVYTLILLVLVGGSLVHMVARDGWRRALLFFAIWGGLFGVIFVGYSLRFELRDIGYRVMAEFDPKRYAIVGDHTVIVRGDERGHYVVRAEIKGGGRRDGEISMLVDTGATTVVLTPQHAKELGFALDDQIYSVPVLTAGGTVYVAPVRLESIAIGDIVVTDIPAYISKVAMDESLLGMSFLGKLKSFKVSERGLEMAGFVKE